MCLVRGELVFVYLGLFSCIMMEFLIPLSRMEWIPSSTVSAYLSVSLSGLDWVDCLSPIGDKGIYG